MLIICPFPVKFIFLIDNIFLPDFSSITLSEIALKLETSELFLKKFARDARNKYD